MKILGLDSAQGACSAAVWQDGKVLAHQNVLMRAGHAEALVPMAADVMASAGLKMSDLDRLTATIGPGTFTGTRIALSVVRGMALALKIPVVGVTTLEAVAHSIPQAPDIIRVACFDAKRGELYVQAFAGAALEPLMLAAALPHSDAAEAVLAVVENSTILIAGTGTEILEEMLEARGASSHTPDLSPHPDAALVVEIAASREPGTTLPAPLYLRAPDAKLPASK